MSIPPVLFGFILSCAFFIGWQMLTPSQPPTSGINVQSTIESIKEVGELVVVRAVTKEIVTQTIAVDDGAWVFSKLGSPKMACYIVKFEMDLRYDLKSDKFKIYKDGQRISVVLPPLKPKYSIKEVKIYDKRDGSWAFSTYKVTVEDENRLLAAATEAAKRQAQEILEENRNLALSAASHVLTSILSGAGVDKQLIDIRQE